MANLGLADDGLQVRRGLEIIGVGTAHEWFDGRLPDGPAKEQLDDGVFGHGSDARQDLDQLVVPGVGPCQVNVLHVSSERFLALNGQPVQNGLRVLGTAAVFHRFYSRDKFTKKKQTNLISRIVTAGSVKGVFTRFQWRHLSHPQHQRIYLNKYQ